MLQSENSIIAINGKDPYPLISAETQRPLLIFDFEGKFLYLNPFAFKLLDCTTKDIRYRFFTDFVYSSDVSKVLSAIRAMLRLGGRPLILRHRLCRGESSFVQVRVDGRILHNAGKPYAVQFILSTLNQIEQSESFSESKFQW
jgi:hypothetical protein